MKLSKDIERAIIEQADRLQRWFSWAPGETEIYLRKCVATMEKLSPVRATPGHIASFVDCRLAPIFDIVSQGEKK